jgi:hypothetical protein
MQLCAWDGEGAVVLVMKKPSCANIKSRLAYLIHMMGHSASAAECNGSLAAMWFINVSHGVTQ